MTAPRHRLLAVLFLLITACSASAGSAHATTGFTGSGTLTMIEDETAGPDRYAVVDGDTITPVAATAAMADAVGDTVTMVGGRIRSLQTVSAGIPSAPSVLMLQVRFAGSTASFAPSSMQASAKKTADYYKAVSGGSVDMLVDVVPDPINGADAFNNDCFSRNLLDDALAGARSQGFEPDDYDRVVLVQRGSSGCPMAGFATINSRYAFLMDTNLHGTVVHELGHTFGSRHARGLHCKDDAGVPVPLTATCTNGTQTVADNAIEYGDAFDRMGGHETRSTSTALFATWRRAALGVLAGTSQTLTRSGTVRVDAADTTGMTLLTIPRITNAGDTGQSFVVEKRRPVAPFETFLPTDPFSTGVIVRLVDALDTTGRSDLIDMAPETATFVDAPLTAGRTFTDPASGITITATSVTADTADVSVTIPDRTAPPAPAGLRGQRDSATAVSLAWGSVADDSAPVRYEVRRDGTPLVTDTALQAKVGDDGRAHQFTVVAIDGAGNRSPESAPVTVAAVVTAQSTGRPSPLDTTAPLVSLTRTAVGFSRRFSVGTSDSSGPVSVTIRVGWTTTRGATRTLTRTQMRRSIVTVTATDALGNRATVRYRISRGRVTRV